MFLVRLNGSLTHENGSLTHENGSLTHDPGLQKTEKPKKKTKWRGSFDLTKLHSKEDIQLLVLFGGDLSWRCAKYFWEFPQSESWSFWKWPVWENSLQLNYFSLKENQEICHMTSRFIVIDFHKFVWVGGYDEYKK